MCELLSCCCWQLCQWDCSCRAQLLLTVQGNCFLLEKLQKGQTSVLYCSSSSRDLTLLRSQVRQCLKESMGKAPSEEEQGCCPRLTCHPEPRAAPHRMQQIPCGCSWQERGFWGGREHLFVAPCNSLGCQKTFSNLQGGDLRHPPILLAIDLCCREAAPETAPTYSQGEIIFTFKFW